MLTGNISLAQDFLLNCNLSLENSKISWEVVHQFTCAHWQSLIEILLVCQPPLLPNLCS